MDIQQIIILIIALYGAIISTILLYNNFYPNLKKLKIESSTIKSINSNEDFFMIKCVNNGRRPITITSYGIYFSSEKDKLKAPFTFENNNPKKLPLKLEDGDSYKVYSDTNNKGLTTGILMDVLNRISNNGTKDFVEGDRARKALNAIFQIEVGEEDRS